MTTKEHFRQIMRERRNHKTAQIDGVKVWEEKEAF